MKRLSLLFAVLTVVLMGLIVVPVLGFTQATPITIEDPTAILEGIGATNNINTFYANGRHWIMYMNTDDDLVYRSADGEQPDTWTAETVVVADTVGYGPEMSIWFDDDYNTISYARHDYDSETTQYRKGIPQTDGTIVWLDIEQTVHATPSNLVTFRISMCTDTDGNPWVAWVDNDPAVDNTTGILYIESSSTDNGTWTQWAYENITTVGWHVWFPRIIPLSSAPYPRVEVQWTTENSTHATKLMASDESDNFTATYTIAAATRHERPDAFGSNNLGSSAVYCVYTDYKNDIMFRGRSAAQTWTAADMAEEIVSDVGSVGAWRPSLVNNGGPYEDLFCIFSDNSGIYQIIRDPIAGWDLAATSVYYNDEGVINRHTTSYDCYESAGSPLGLAFQYTDGTDAVYYWWSTDGEWGYYAGTETEEAIFDLAMILPYVFVGVALVAMVGMAMSGVVSVGGIIVLAIASVVTVVGLGVITAALNAW